MLLLPAFVGVPEVNRVYHVEALTLCAALAPSSVDMILIDPPYQVTSLKWDVIIPFDAMWQAFKRVIKPRGAIVLTAIQPFTSMLIMSNLEMFRYEWIWDKKLAVNFLNAKRQPLKRHENVLVFGFDTPNYYPIMRKGKLRLKTFPDKPAGVYGARGSVSKVNDDYYPVSILEFHNADQSDKVHPTQKPVALFEYLIRTYTQVGDVVLDPTCGSGTTAIAARNTGRNFICGDTSLEYVEVARKRLAQPYTIPMMLEASA